MNDEQILDWQDTRARGRADFALRRGVLYGLPFWVVHFVFGDWSGAGEVLMALPFYICVFVAAAWFAFWPLRERDYQRAIQQRSAQSNENAT